MKTHIKHPSAGESSKPKPFVFHQPTFVLQVMDQSMAYTECEPVIRRLLRSSYGAVCQGLLSDS